MKRLSLVLVCFAVLGAAHPASAGTLYRLDADVVYGHKMGMALTYDVIEPAEANGAAVLFMVSGGWMSRWFDPDGVLESSKSLSSLVERGFTVFLVRHGSSPLFKVPDAVDDVRAAVRHIRKNAATWSVDPERLGVFGGSAGGHLSLMLGAASQTGMEESGSSFESDRVAAVVALYPPVDLQQWVGPNDRFPALDFDPDLADDVSPLLFVSKDDPPTLLIHGDKDELVPLSHSQSILEAFEREGVSSELIVLEGAGHGFRGEHDATAVAALVQWFEEYLLPEPVTSATSGSQQP